MKKEKVVLKNKYTFILIVVISILITLFCIYLQPGSYVDSLINFINRPIIIFLNFFPVIILTTLMYYLIGNLFLGASISSFILLLMSYINLIKIEGRNDPFVPRDVVFIKEAFISAFEYKLDMHYKALFLIIIYCLILIILGIYFKNSIPKFKIRIGLIFLICTVFTLSIKFLYSNKKIYDTLNKANDKYNISYSFNTLGFNYCFLYNLNLYEIEKPSDYNSLEVKKWNEQYLYKKTTVDVKPNIIFVMGEAFSDISNSSIFEWGNDRNNPIYNYLKLTKRENAISGHIIVPNIYAGTANTEFDVLTGIPTTMISKTNTSSFYIVRNRKPTIASLLKKEGYSTTFLHPGYSWFYNRDNVYDYFDFDNRLFLENFSDLSDKTFLKVLKQVIDNNDGPMLVYGVTVQNHQAYNYSKFNDKTSNVSVNVDLTDKEMENLSVYLRGAKDTANMVYELANYIDTLEEPTILVFFGDHLPNINNKDSIYYKLNFLSKKTDDIENTLIKYKTPFLIYSNDSYYNKIDFKKNKESLKLPSTNIINSNYLGITALEFIGYRGYDSFFDYLSYAKTVLPVFRTNEKIYILEDGTYTDELEHEKYLDIIKKIDWWKYYRLKK